MISHRWNDHLQEVMESEEFLLLPVNQLVDIISSDELNVRSEEHVFTAVMSWVKHNVTERRQYLGQILSHVRLPLLSPKYLVGTVGSDLLVKSDEICRDLVDEAKNYLLLPQVIISFQITHTQNFIKQRCFLRILFNLW